MALFRLLTFVRCFNASLPKKRSMAINFESLSTDTLLNPQAVFSVNDNKKYAHLVAGQPQIHYQEFDFDKKMKVLSWQASRYGRIIKFNVDDILQDIQNSSETVTSLQGLFLLQCCTELIDDKSPALRTQLGEEIWRTLKKLDVDLDVSHYNTLLSIYLENECDFSPLAFLEEMLNANILPNKVTFQRLILQFCNKGKITEANQIVENMNKSQIPMNEEILSSFIWGYTMNNDMNSAHKILKEMESLEIKPTIRTFSTLMYAYAVNGDMDSIRQIFAECEDKDIWVPDKVLLKVVYHLSLNGFTDFIDEILSKTTKGALYIKDANRMMYKLIEKQQEDVAFKIFQTLHKDKTSEISGNFFIDTLINFEVPIEKSVKFCQIMVEEGIHQRSFLSAINKSLANDMYDSSITLMKAWQKLGGQVREHYFYPIFKAYGETKQWEGIEKVLQKMILDFCLPPSMYMLKTHVLPYMQKSAHDVLMSLRSVHVNFNTAVKAILLYLLSENKIREASKFVNNYNIIHKIEIIKYNLLEAFKNTEDAPSFVSILHYIYNARLNKDMDIDTTDNKYLAQQFIDSCIIEAIDFISPNNKYLLLMLFRNLIDRGLSISPETAEKVKNKLKNYLTGEMADALNTLKSGNVIPKPITQEFSSLKIKKYTDIEKLESTAKILTITNNKIAQQLKQDLLIFHCNNLNEKKVEELLEDSKINNINITTLIYLSLINMYLNLQKTDKAEFWLCQYKKMHPSIKLKKIIILKLVTALIENGQIEKAQEHLIWPSHTNSFNSFHDCRKLLSSVSKLNDEKLLQKFFDLLKNNHYFNITKIPSLVLDPFIQIHLARNDPASAVQTFEWIYKTYNKAPCKVQLMKACVKSGDNDLLKRVKKICESITSETETNFLVAIAYLENNDLLKAKDIIQNYCTELYEENVIYFAENYYLNGQINYLEKLFEVLNALKFDVERLCVLLLKSYSIQKEWKKGYNLWMKMQKEDIVPSDIFINCLNLILREKNELGNDSLQKFNTAICNGELETARELLNSLSLVYKSDCYSLLCKKYIAMNSFSLAINLWQELVQKWHLELNLDVAESILSKLVKEKDVSNIERIGSYLSRTYKSQSNYKFFLSQAYLKSGSWNVFMKHWESKLEDVPVTCQSLDFHNKTLVSSLIMYPELTQQFERLVYKFNEKNFWIPVQILWIYYFLQKSTKADEIWLNYIKHKPFYLWLTVLDYPQFQKDGSTYLKVTDLIGESALTQNLKFSAYSKVIRSCMDLKDSKKYEYGLRCLRRAMLEFSMEKFDVNLLTDLQIGLENSGIPWPWSAN